MRHNHTPAIRATSALAVAILLSSVLGPVARAGDMVSALHCTLLVAPTSSVRYVGHYVGRIHWIDCRSVSPATATVNVYRVYSEGPGTDTVASVVCSGGLGRGAPNTNTWFGLLGEYFRFDGCTTGTIRVITSGVP
jgi:hypothetical protein